MKIPPSENPSLQWCITQSLRFVCITIIMYVLALLFYYSKINCLKANAIILLFYSPYLEYNDLNVNHCFIQIYWMNNVCDILFKENISFITIFKKIIYHKIYQKEIKELQACFLNWVIYLL